MVEQQQNGISKEEKKPETKSRGGKRALESVEEEQEEIPKKSRTKKAKIEDDLDGAVETKPTKSRARKVTVDEEEEVDKHSNVTKRKPAKMNKTETSYETLDFGMPSGANFKISSWNVAGLRAWVVKQGMDYVEYEQPDIFCLQEIKCTEDQLPAETKVKGYHTYWNAKPGGHAGVALYTKQMPYDVKYGIGDNEYEQSGNIITAEYSTFFLVNVYVPNSGRKLVNLDERMRWDELFRDYVKKLDARKPVIICGDLNVSHTEIDLANPKTNKRNAGFTQEERDGMTKLLELGFVDTFRSLYPKKEKAYTFWTYMGNARGKNVGWRLDYFIVSERLQAKVVDNVMRSQCMGSDHCPIALFMNF